MIYHHSVGGGLRECQKVPGVLPSGEGLQLRGSQAQRSDLREAESTREGEMRTFISGNLLFALAKCPSLSKIKDGRFCLF